jgi:hypothetical protein
MKRKIIHGLNSASSIIAAPRVLGCRVPAFGFLGITLPCSGKQGKRYKFAEVIMVLLANDSG